MHWHKWKRVEIGNETFRYCDRHPCAEVQSRHYSSGGDFWSTLTESDRAKLLTKLQKSSLPQLTENPEFPDTKGTP